MARRKHCHSRLSSEPWNIPWKSVEKKILASMWNKPKKSKFDAQDLLYSIKKFVSVRIILIILLISPILSSSIYFKKYG